MYRNSLTSFSFSYKIYFTTFIISSSLISTPTPINSSNYFKSIYSFSLCSFKYSIAKLYLWLFIINPLPIYSHNTLLCSFWFIAAGNVLATLYSNAPYFLSHFVIPHIYITSTKLSHIFLFFIVAEINLLSNPMSKNYCSI